MGSSGSWLASPQSRCRPSDPGWHPSRPQSQGHGARSHLPGPHWLRSLGDRPAPVCLCVALPAAHCCQLPAVDSPRVSPLGSGALSWPADGGVEWLSRLRWSWKGLISYRVVIAGAARDPRPLGLDTGQADHGLGVASGPCRETLRGSGGGLPGPASPLTLGPSWCRPHTHMRAHGRPPPCCRCRRVPAVWTPCLEPGGPRLTCPYWVGPCWPWVPWTWPSGLRGQGAPGSARSSSVPTHGTPASHAPACSGVWSQWLLDREARTASGMCLGPPVLRDPILPRPSLGTWSQDPVEHRDRVGSPLWPGSGARAHV